MLTEQAERTIIFVKTRDRLTELLSELEREQILCAWIQDEIPQDRRNNAISRFRDGIANILIATDITARSIDLPDMIHVINYDIPQQC